MEYLGGIVMWGPEEMPFRWMRFNNFSSKLPLVEVARILRYRRGRGEIFTMVAQDKKHATIFPERHDVWYTSGSS